MLLVLQLQGAKIKLVKCPLYTSTTALENGTESIKPEGLFFAACNNCFVVYIVSKPIEHILCVIICKILRFRIPGGLQEELLTGSGPVSMLAAILPRDFICFPPFSPVTSHISPQSSHIFGVKSHDADLLEFLIVC
jgi:hypothetical protein